MVERTRTEIEVENAVGILKAMAGSIDELERRWPASKRGANGQRALDEIKQKRAVALQCLFDAQGDDNNG